MNDDTKVYSVGELTRLVKGLLEGDKRLSPVYVKGEITNYRPSSTGHLYFSLKDEDALLKAVLFKWQAAKLKFRMENGMKVIAFGRISVYMPDGTYSLRVEDLRVEGVGELFMAYEQLKARLRAEGLFDPAHKKPLPPYPQRIAVVTSDSGQAVHDIITTTRERYPLAKLIILPVLVQGERAPAEIASAIRYANKHKVADLIITGRGGGSMEELWAFNDERVARAIYASELPVISAVGHEQDFTIADFVADVRANAPTKAAEVSLPDQKVLLKTIREDRERMLGALTSRLEAEKLRLRKLRERRVLQDPGVYLDDRSLALDRLTERLEAAITGLITRRRGMELNRLEDRLGHSIQVLVTRRRAAFASRAAALDALSPLKVLGRGYSIASLPDGTLVRSRAQVRPGDRLRIQVAEGHIPCEVLREGEDQTDGRE